MLTFAEHFANTTQHPLYQAATKAGFEHLSTSSAAGVTTHKFDHPKGHTLDLVSSNGNHTFAITTARGKKLSGSTPMNFFGATLQL